MSDYVIITDSSSDLTQEIVEKYHIEVVPLTVTVEGKDYKNYLDEREIKFVELFDHLRAGHNVITAAVNVEAFTEAMKKHLEKGCDILYIGFASTLSSTFQSAVIAAQELKNEYPNNKIYYVDTKSASLGEGLAVYLSALKKDEGKTIDEVYHYVSEMSPKVAHWFTVNDLFFLKKGGRLNATTAVVGTMLSIKPVLHFDPDGKLQSVANIRSRKASLRMLADNFEKSCTDKSIACISHGDCMEDVEYLSSLLREKGAETIIVNYLGPVNSVHSGPGTMALFFQSDGR